MTLQHDRDPFTEHTRRVRTLEQAGITPPDEWTKVRQRFDEFLALKTPCRDRLTQAITNPDDADIPVLRAAAFAEATIVPATNHAVKGAVYAKLVEVYSPVARSNYKKVATRFNDAATNFTAAADVVNPETAAEAMVTAPEASRTAWSQAPLHAGRLDALMPALIAAAELCGVSIVKDERMQLPLVVDDRGSHRRRLWEAWNHKDGRCGRWTAILATGAAIKAADLANLHPYALPRPLETSQEHRAGMVFSVVRDPDDTPEAVKLGV